MSKILYLSYDGMTDALGQSQVLPYIFGLKHKGHNFHLISFEKKDRFEKFGKQIQKLCEENGIVWHPLNYTKKPPLLSTIWDVFKLSRKTKKLHKSENFDMLHCRSYISTLVGLNMKRSFNIPFLFDMRGFWANERVDGKIWKLSNPIFRIVFNYFKKKEKQFIKESAHIISLTQTGKDEIMKWGTRIESSKISIIPCCVDLKKFDPKQIKEESKLKIESELGLGNNSILGYVGSIGTWYMLKEMLLFFKIYQLNFPKAKFLFVTAENPETILIQAKKYDIETSNIKIVSCLHHEVPLYISLFSHSVFFILPSYSKKASSPTKQGELMAMGIPLICNANVGDTEKIVIENGSGSVVNDFDDLTYQKAIHELVHLESLDFQIRTKSVFGLEEGVSKYVRVYKQILE